MAPNCVRHLGKHVGIARVSRDERHPHRATGPTGPRALQLGERRAAGDASDRPCRHSRPSDGETVAPLEPPRLQDGPARRASTCACGTRGYEPFSEYSVGKCASRQFSLSRQPYDDPEPVRRRFDASAFESIPAAGGESSHVRRDLPMASSRIAWHGVRSSNYPYRGSFRTCWLDAEGGERAFGTRGDPGRRSLDTMHRVPARPGLREHLAALAFGNRAGGVHGR